MIHATASDRDVFSIQEGGQFILAFQYLASNVTRPGVYEQIAAYIERQLCNPPTKESIEATIEGLYRDLRVWFSWRTLTIGCSEQPKSDDWQAALRFAFEFGGRRMDEVKLPGFEMGKCAAVTGCPAEVKRTVHVDETTNKDEEQQSKVADIRRLWDDRSKRST